ncbi:MAG: MobC family plasmid mobilization relaxosome protein [Flavobacteriales bacterium]|nr:MobC family plasmid mobilization relaxosome protein [Flavobacteriales bacterium]
MSKDTERKQEYRKRHRTFSVSLPKVEAEKVLNHAKSTGFSVPELIKALIKADMEGNGYVLPDDGKLEQMVYEFKKIGNNLNQTVRFANSRRELDLKGFQQMQELLKQLEETVIETITLPPSIFEVLKQYLEQHPDEVGRLTAWLNTYDNQGHST